MTQRVPVAVIIPVYNRRLKLIATLESVVAQSKLPAIVIVVDDGSTDRTAEAAVNWLSLNAPFEWKVVRLETNAGVSVARNTGFNQIGGLPFVCFLDSDDFWPPNFIAEGLRALEENENAVAAVADRVRIWGTTRRRVEKLGSVVINPFLWVICNDASILSCTMIRSSAARAAGLFPPGMLAGEDIDFLLRLFLLGGAAYSKARPVSFVKNAPLESTEAPNLSRSLPLPDRRYLSAWVRSSWTRHLTHSVSGLPKPLPKEYEYLIRTALARRWANAALSSRHARNYVRALTCVLQAIWWDHRWGRRLRLIWWFSRSRRRAVDAHYPNPLRPKTQRKRCA